MARVFSRDLLLAAGSAVSLVPSLAVAQSKTATSTAVASDPEGSTTPGQAADDIVVTARRRAENSQTVPISITAFSQEALRRQNISNVNDLQYSTPSLSVQGQTRDLQSINIRGQGQSSQSSDSGVVSYQNEVPLCCDTLAQTIGGSGIYYDLDSLQVLKGPQGTLFGRNSVGGALLIQTKRPTEAFGGYLQGTIGSYANREFEGALNVPLAGDKLLLRVAGYRQKQRGYTRSLGTADHPNGTRLDDADTWAGRATLTFKPTESFTNDLIYNHLESDTNGSSILLGYVDPAGTMAAVFPQILALVQQQQALGIRTQIATSSIARAATNYNSVVNISRLELSPTLTLRNIVSYSKINRNVGNDYDGTILPAVDFPDVDFPSEQFTEELQFQGQSFDNRFNWTIGGFYLKSPLQRFATGISTVFGQKTDVRYAYGDNDSKALYGQGTFDLDATVRGLKATAGFRYTWDKRSISVQNLNGNSQCTAPLAGADANCIRSGQRSFSAPAWTLGLDWTVAPGTLVYVANRRAYKSGGLDRTAPSRSFEPEYVTDIEAGVKSDWTLGGLPVRTNLAYYYQWYKNIQASALTLANGQVVSTIDNDVDARIQGVEFETNINLTPTLQVGGTFNWLGFKYTRFGPTVDQATLLQNQDIQRPPYKFTVNGRWSPDFGNAGRPYISANYGWQAESGVRFPTGRAAAYGLLNISAGWDGIGGTPIDASVFVTNAFDIERPIFTIALVGYAASTYNQPRMIGLRLRYRFGDQAQ